MVPHRSSILTHIHIVFHGFFVQPTFTSLGFAREGDRRLHRRPSREGPDVELWGPWGTKVEKTTGKKQLFGNGKGWKGKENGGLGMENDGLRQVEWFIPPKNHKI